MPGPKVECSFERMAGQTSAALLPFRVQTSGVPGAQQAAPSLTLLDCVLLAVSLLPTSYPSVYPSFSPFGENMEAILTMGLKPIS